MPVRPANLRIAKWKAKMAGEALSVVTGKQLENMTDQISTIFPEIERVENATKVILEEAMVTTLENPSYLNFARQVYRCTKRFAGGQLLNAVNVYFNRWFAEGLDEDILDKIRDAVFSLAPPVP